MTMGDEVFLGDLARDKVTGLAGICVARIAYLDGSQQAQIQPKELHEGKPIEALWFAQNRLEVVEKDAFKTQFNGG
jgi:hypothetical protein